MNIRFLIFILVATAILSLTTFYVGTRAIEWSLWARSHRSLVWMTLGLVIVLQLLGPYLYRVFPDHFNRFFVLEWVAYTTLGVLTSMFFYTAVVDLLAGLWTLIAGDHQLEHLNGLRLAAVSVLMITTLVIGTYQALSGPKVYDVTIPIANLPKDFEGFRIVQISDLHVGSTIGRDYTERVAKLAQSLTPDLVVLTGDLIDGSVSQLRSFLEPLTEIKSGYGSFVVTGNHEYYWGAPEWISEFQRMGMKVLQNEYVVLKKNDSELVLAGITDESAGHILPEQASDLQKSLAGTRAEDIKILLAHHPSGYAQASKLGVQLQLSGHTHGGQFFPWSPLVGLVYRYYRGLSRYEQMWIYVSRGTGYWGPPLRFLVPAEITLIRLSASQG